MGKMNEILTAVVKILKNTNYKLELTNNLYLISTFILNYTY